MKKGRPGHLLGALVEGDKQKALVELVRRESTTLGVRSDRVERTALDRHQVKAPDAPWPGADESGDVEGGDANAAPGVRRRPGAGPGRRRPGEKVVWAEKSRPGLRRD